MTEPLKPRIDFDGPLEVDQNPKFRAQQTFDENQAQNFAPATLDEAQEEVGFEIAAAAVLHADQHRPQGGNGDGDDEGRPGTAQQVDDQAPEQPRAHGEQ